MGSDHMGTPCEHSDRQGMNENIPVTSLAGGNNKQVRVCNLKAKQFILLGGEI